MLNIFNFNPDQEKEVSSGAVIGYALLGFALVFVIAFAIFIGISKFKGDDEVETAPVATEAIVESEELNTETEVDDTTK